MSNKTPHDIVTSWLKSPDTDVYIIENLDDTHPDIFFEMANYTIVDSGLPHNIWFDEPGLERNNKHHLPRVKIQVNKSWLSVSVSAQPTFLLKGQHLADAEKKLSGSERKKMFDFISKNNELILSHWNGKVTTMQLLNGLS